MIEEINIVNYQSHKKTDLLLSPKINVIVGESDNGKSAIYRAIKMAFFNQSGNDFIRSNEKECFVNIKLDDCRIKIDKPANQITLNKEIYASIGRSIPDVVKSVTKIKEIDFVDDIKKNVCFQDQHDYKFMVDDEIENSRILGSISGINGLLNGIKLSNKNKKALSIEKKILFNTIESKTKEIKKYDGIEQIKESISNVNATIEEVKRDEEKLNKIKLLNTKLDDNTQNLHNNKVVLKKYSDIYEFKDKINITNENYKFYEKLIYFKNKIVNISNTIYKLNKELKNVNEVIGFSNEINDLEKSYAALNNIKNYSNKFCKINNSISSETKKLNQFNFIINKKDIIKELSKEYTLYLSVKEKNEHLNKIIDDVKIKKNQEKLLKESILTFTEEHNKLINSLDVCEKCKRPYTEKDKESMKL